MPCSSVDVAQAEQDSSPLKVGAWRVAEVWRGHLNLHCRGQKVSLRLNPSAGSFWGGTYRVPDRAVAVGIKSNWFKWLLTL